MSRGSFEEKIEVQRLKEAKKGLQQTQVLRQGLMVVKTLSTTTLSTTIDKSQQAVERKTLHITLLKFFT